MWSFSQVRKRSLFCPCVLQLNLHIFSSVVYPYHCFFVSLSLSVSLFIRTVMLAQSTDSGQLIAAAVIKLFHAMKVEVQDLRGVGIQVQLLEGHQSATQDCRGLRGRSIKEMLLGQASSARSTNRGAFSVFWFRLSSLLSVKITYVL